MHNEYVEWMRFKSLKLKSENTKKRYTEILETLPQLEELTTDYILQELNRFAPATRQLYLSIVRQVLRFYEKGDIIKNIKLPRPKTSVTAKDLYTPDELLAILQKCQTPQDRATIEVLYESGCRSSEFLSMTIKGIKFESGIAWLHIDGKTGDRAVPIRESLPSLREWLNNHPVGEGHVWVKPKIPFTVLRRQDLHDRVKRLLKQSNIVGKKRIVHLFRHTRLTELARMGLSEAELCAFAGWEQGSNMPNVYIHLSSRDIKGAIMSKVFNLSVDEVEPVKSLLAARTCPTCKARNPSTAIRCSICNTPLILDDIDRLIQEKDSELKSEIDTIKADMKRLMRFVSDRMSQEDKEQLVEEVIEDGSIDLIEEEVYDKAQEMQEISEDKLTENE